MDSNHRSRKTADLQSAPFGHSGKHPSFVDVGGFEPSTLCLSDRYSKPAELNVLFKSDAKVRYFSETSKFLMYFLKSILWGGWKGIDAIEEIEEIEEIDAIEGIEDIEGIEGIEGIDAIERIDAIEGMEDMEDIEGIEAME